MLAYAPATTTCQQCKDHVACGARCADLRPRFIKLLDCYNDESGRTMSHAWLTRGERAARKKAAVDDDIATMALVGDVWSAPLLRKASRLGIDPATCELNELARVSKNVRATVDLLQREPSSCSAIANNLIECARLAPSTAKRTASAVVSFLIANGRARQTDNIVELA